MRIERKPLYNLILATFRSNEESERFLRDQADWGDKLANAVPNPRVSVEEYAWETADRLVRWGYAQDYLVAFVAKDTLDILQRRIAAELLGMEPGVVEEIRQRPTTPPPKPQEQETMRSATSGGATTTAGERVRWVFWLQLKDNMPSSAVATALRAAIASDLDGMSVGGDSPEGLIIAEHQTPEPSFSTLRRVLVEIPLVQAEGIRERLIHTHKSSNLTVLAAASEQSEVSPELVLEEIHGDGLRFRICKRGGFSALVSAAVPDPRAQEQANGGEPTDLQGELTDFFDSSLHSAMDKASQQKRRMVQAALQRWSVATLDALLQAGPSRSARLAPAAWFANTTCLELAFAPASPHARWPWETLVTSTLLALPVQAIVRSVQETSPRPTDTQITLQSPPRVLLISPRRNADAVGYRAVSEALIESALRSGALLHELLPATPTALRALANSPHAPQFDVLHFDGHGEKNGALLFESGDAPTLAPSEARTIVAPLKALGVRLVVLTACHSAAANASFVASAAETLCFRTDSEIRQCVAMGWEVTARRAKVFVEGFYGSLMLQSVEDVDAAINAGCEAMACEATGTDSPGEDIIVRRYRRPNTKLRMATQQLRPHAASDAIFGADAPLIGQDQALHALNRWWAGGDRRPLLVCGGDAPTRASLVRHWARRLWITRHLGPFPAQQQALPPTERRLLLSSNSDIASLLADQAHALGLSPDANVAVNAQRVADAVESPALVVWTPPLAPEGQHAIDFLDFADRLGKRGSRMVLVVESASRDLLTLNTIRVGTLTG